jgi:hypothetical protein
MPSSAHDDGWHSQNAVPFNTSTAGAQRAARE